MFDKSTWIRLPRSVVVGHGVLDQVVDVVGELYLDGRPLIVTSPTPKSLAADRLRKGFDEIGIDPAVVIVETATFSAVEDVLAAAETVDAGYLIGLGGGKPIDIAKMAADERGCGLISVPTAASHDGIVSGRGSVPDGDTRHSVAAHPPLAVIADTELISEAPWRLTTAGCADIISNYTAVKDWQLANRLKNVQYSEYAGALSQMTAEMLVDRSDSINAASKSPRGSSSRPSSPPGWRCRSPAPRVRLPERNTSSPTSWTVSRPTRRFTATRSASPRSSPSISTAAKAANGDGSGTPWPASKRRQQRRDSGSRTDCSSKR